MRLYQYFASFTFDCQKTVKMRTLVVKRKNKNLVILTTVSFTRFLEPVIGIGEPRRKNSPLDCFCLRACWLQTSFALDHSFSIPLVISCIKNAPFFEGCILYGASDRNWTNDLLITSQLLYQLSYTGMVTRGRVELPTPPWKGDVLTDWPTGQL